VETDLARLSMDSDVGQGVFQPASDSSGEDALVQTPLSPSRMPQPVEAGAESILPHEKRVTIKMSSSGLNLGSLASAALEDASTRTAPPSVFGSDLFLASRTLPAAPAPPPRPALHSASAGPSLALRAFDAFSLSSLVDDTLAYYTERGDPLMCVAIATVLDRVHPVPEERVARWEWAYVGAPSGGH
jgi:hypothetical protein